MKKSILLVLVLLSFLASCNDEKKTIISDSEEDSLLDLSEEDRDTIFEEAIVEPIKKSAKQLKDELTAKGFKTFDYVDKKTQDTILMQQYFMAFLKTGPIRGQNEEESALLQEEHLDHLTKMYELGYADISGPFADDGDIRGITIYNVPTLKMADSLANADPMVKAGRLEIEIHPWWAAKGFPLR